MLAGERESWGEGRFKECVIKPVPTDGSWSLPNSSGDQEIT